MIDFFNNIGAYINIVYIIIFLLILVFIIIILIMLRRNRALKAKIKDYDNAEQNNKLLAEIIGNHQASDINSAFKVADNRNLSNPSYNNILFNAAAAASSNNNSHIDVSQFYDVSKDLNNPAGDNDLVAKKQRSLKNKNKKKILSPEDFAITNIPAEHTTDTKLLNSGIIRSYE